MKKSLVFITFFMLVLIQGVFATISVVGPSKTIYNLGDRIGVEGFILEDQPVTGLFTITLDCGGTSVQLGAKSIDLSAGEKYIFSEILAMPGGIAGTCNLALRLSSNNQVVDETISPNFNIVKDLDGSFNVEAEKVQLGANVIVNGNVFKLDGSTISGIATIYFVKDNQNYFVDSVNVVSGGFKFLSLANFLPAGSYSVDVFASDVFGNQRLFEDVVSFEVVDLLNVNANLKELHLLPGKKLVIKGTAEKILGGVVDSGEVKIIIDNFEDKAEIIKGSFSYETTLKNDIKSGPHNVILKARDKAGNHQELTLEFIVDPIPNTIAVEIEDDRVMPAESFRVKVLLYDQAKNLIQDKVSIEIYDTKGKKRFSQLTDTDTLVEFPIDQFAVPGKWTIKSYSRGLVREDVFYVGEVSTVDVSLEGSRLIIKNIGNNKYENPISVSLEGGGNLYKIVKKTSLSPNQIMEIDLSKEATSGTYKVTVSYDDEKKVFEDVSIVTGKFKKNLDLIYVIGAIVLLILFYLFMLYLKRRRRLSRVYKPSKDTYAVKKVKPSAISDRHYTKEERIKDFKDMMLRGIKETEKKKEEGRKGGMFDMFR